MLMVTKNGLKLWASGMLAGLVIGGLGIVIPYLEIAEASLVVHFMYYVVILPMAVGAVQRWLWS